MQMWDLKRKSNQRSFLSIDCSLPIGSVSDPRVSRKASIALLETGARSFWPFHDALSNVSVQIGNRFSYSLSQPILHSYSHSHLCVSHSRTVRILHILHSYSSRCHNITAPTHLPKFIPPKMSTNECFVLWGYCVESSYMQM